MRIIFVCEGNIIRSPLARNLFQFLVEEQGLSDKYELDSAGTSAYHVGEQPDSRMREVARARGIQYSGKSRQFKREDLDEFDLIVAMDKSNRQLLNVWAKTPEQQKKIHMMREYDPEGNADQNVPDPYYYPGLKGFEEVFEIIQRSCLGLMEALEGGKN